MWRWPRGFRFERRATRSCRLLLVAAVLSFAGPGLRAEPDNAAYCQAPAHVPKVVRDLAEVAQLSSFGGSQLILALRRDGTIATADPNAPSRDDHVAVTLGRYHGAAITRDRTVVVWGVDIGAREYGLGAYVDVEEGEIEHGVFRVPPLVEVKALAAGESHTLALLADGTVWAWGGNDWGQLGSDAGTPGSSMQAPRNGEVQGADLNAFSHVSRPRPVPGLAQVVAIAAGARHSVALRRDGSVWTWGNDSYTGSDRRTVAAADHYRLARSSGAFRATPVRVPGLSRVVAIAAGFHYTLAVRDDGTLWSWGANECGQLGRPRVVHRAGPAQKLSILAPEYEAMPSQVPGIRGVKSVAAGLSHSVALTRDGRVWTWGDNKFGQLGALAHLTPAGEGLCMRSMGPPWQDRSAYRSVPVVVEGLHDVTQVGAGELHSMALHRDGRVSVWGSCAGCPGLVRADYDRDKPCAFQPAPRTFKPPQREGARR